VIRLMAPFSMRCNRCGEYICKSQFRRSFPLLLYTLTCFEAACPVLVVTLLTVVFA
jgi:hypothetical protein